MYLTYKEYQQYGGMLSEMDFDRIEYSAGKTVQAHTFCRIDKMSETPEAVKRLMYEIITIESNSQQVRTAESGALTGFNTDGYSESYGEAMSSAYLESLEDDMIRRYLLEETDDYGTPLLYMGV